MSTKPSAPNPIALLALTQAMQGLQKLADAHRGSKVYDQLLTTLDGILIQFKAQQQRLDAIQQKLESQSKRISALVIKEDEKEAPKLIQHLQRNYQYQELDMNRFSVVGINWENIDLLIGLLVNPTVRHLEQLVRIQTELPCYIPVGVFAMQLSNRIRKVGFALNICPMVANPLNLCEVDNYILAQVRRKQRIESAFFANLFKPTDLYEAKRPQLLLALDEIIESNLDELTIHLLCQGMNYSRSHLSRKIKALTGLKLTEYVNRYKLEKSKQLLTHTEWAISRISDTLGFCSQQYFTRLFSRRFGISPSKYRASIARNDTIT